MTSPRTWKKGEQYWAELHCEERSGPLGKNEPDTTMNGCPFGIEHKLQGKRALLTKDLEQAKKNATKNGRPFLLCLHEKNKPRSTDLVVMERDTYLMLAAKLLTVPLSPEATSLAKGAWLRWREAHETQK